MEQRLEELHHGLFRHVGCDFQLFGHHGSHFLHGNISAFLLLIQQRIGHEPHEELGWDERALLCSSINDNMLIAFLHDEFSEITDNKFPAIHNSIAQPFYDGSDILFSRLRRTAQPCGQEKNELAIIHGKSI